jgi:hypothetical protein
MEALAQFFADMSDEQREVAIAAMEQKALFKRCGSELYAFVWSAEEHAWHCWKLERNAGEYRVNAELTKCTCPAWERDGRCKHCGMLRYGNL